MNILVKFCFSIVGLQLVIDFIEFWKVFLFHKKAIIL